MLLEVRVRVRNRFTRESVQCALLVQLLFTNFSQVALWNAKDGVLVLCVIMLLIYYWCFRTRTKARISVSVTDVTAELVIVNAVGAIWFFLFLFKKNFSAVRCQFPNDWKEVFII